MKLQARIDRVVQKGNVKAIASVSLDGMFVVKGLKVMDGRKGLFVSMPQESYPGKDGQKQYSNTFFALTNSAKMQLQEVVLDAYKLSLDPNYVPKQSQGQHDYPSTSSISGSITEGSIRTSTQSRGIQILSLGNRNTRNSLVVLMICSPWVFISVAELYLWR